MKEIKTVLLIDDNIHDNYIHSYVIKKEKPDAVIKTAESGDEAIEYFEKSINGDIDCPYPDLIFLDINMPGMNGFEFLKSARSRKFFEIGNPILIFMLTSSLNPGDRQSAESDFSNEVSDFKNKPLTQEMLREIIDTYNNRP